MKTILFFFLLVAIVVSISGQSGKIINDEMHAVSLEGNLIGDSAKRNILVYLPPNYDKQPEVRYPVVYLLHGFSGPGNQTWMIENQGLRMNMRIIMDKLIAEQKVRPMVIVMPDGRNKFGGSFYTNSITTGNWEDFATRDLVSFIDEKYRTISKAESRGIAGHSMGGYSAVKLAMKNPDIYGSIYATSPCCLDAYPNVNTPSRFMIEASAVKSWEEIERATFLSRTFIASAAAFSPNPAKPPFFADFPVKVRGEPDAVAEQALARWLANTPMWMIDQNRANLKRLRGIAFDVGTSEDLLNSIRQFSGALKRNKIEHLFEEFDGDHIDKTGVRIETRIMPFFSRTLAFEQRSIK